MNPGDMITGAVLIGGTVAVNYNFGELLPVSISGHVHVNLSGDCDDPTNPPLPGVTIELLNSTGQVISTTTTNDQGYYIFDTLPPGTYSVREVQPEGYFDGGENVGSAGGIESDDLLSDVVLTSGVARHGLQLLRDSARQAVRLRLRRLEQQRHQGSGRSRASPASPCTLTDAKATRWASRSPPTPTAILLRQPAARHLRRARNAAAELLRRPGHAGHRRRSGPQPGRL